MVPFVQQTYVQATFVHMASLCQEQNPIMNFSVPFLKMLTLCMLWRAQFKSDFYAIRSWSCYHVKLKYLLNGSSDLYEPYARKIVIYHQTNFHKDPCKDARALVVNARNRDEMCTWLSWGPVQTKTVRLQRQIEPGLMEIYLKLMKFLSQEEITKL